MNTSVTLKDTVILLSFVFEGSVSGLGSLEENSVEENASVVSETLVTLLFSVNEDFMSVVISLGGSLKVVVSLNIEDTSVVDESSIVMLRSSDEYSI